jgi:hypothetical protein
MTLGLRRGWAASIVRKRLGEVGQDVAEGDGGAEGSGGRHEKSPPSCDLSVIRIAADRVRERLRGLSPASRGVLCGFVVTRREPRDVEQLVRNITCSRMRFVRSAGRPHAE